MKGRGSVSTGPPAAWALQSNTITAQQRRITKSERGRVWTSFCSNVREHGAMAALVIWCVLK